MSPEFTHPDSVSQVVQMKAIGDKQIVAQCAIGMGACPTCRESVAEHIKVD